MKLKNKGFTMIELLAAVTLLGVLSSVAIVSYTKYQEKVRREAFESMEKSAFSAAQTYIANRNIIIPSDGTEKTIDITTLVEGGYLSKLEDPHAKGNMCHTGSTVRVTKTNNNGTTLEEYTYTVTIRCKKYTSSHVDASGVTQEGRVFKG